MKMKVGTSAAIASFLLISSGILWGTTPGTSMNVQLVGQNTLFGRGMNAASAIFDHFLYVGSRTDGSTRFIKPWIRPTRRAGGSMSCQSVRPLIAAPAAPIRPTAMDVSAAAANSLRWLVAAKTSKTNAAVQAPIGYTCTPKA